MNGLLKIGMLFLLGLLAHEACSGKPFGALAVAAAIWLLRKAEMLKPETLKPEMLKGDQP